MAKKRYQKPAVKKVTLAPEECCVAGCKLVSGTAKAGRMCRSTNNCNNSSAGGS